jgi:6,7-dimethyl-8-ribityllumazine synthase
MPAGTTRIMPEQLQPNRIRGDWNAEGLRFGIIVSRFNSFVTERLLAGGLDSLARAGATSDQVDVVHVPGSFEIPLTAKRMGLTGRYDAIICIGCILRGDTQHYEYICTEAARGIQLAQIDTGVPMVFCVLTCDTLDQAIDRAGVKSGNKGADAGLAAVEIARVLRKLGPAPAPAAKAKAARRSAKRRARRRR